MEAFAHGIYQFRDTPWRGVTRAMVKWGVPHLDPARKASDMGRTLNAVIASLPKVRRDSINARYQALKTEVETLRAKRKAAGKGKSSSS